MTEQKKRGVKPKDEKDKFKPITVARYFHPDVIKEKGEEIREKMLNAVKKVKI